MFRFQVPVFPFSSHSPLSLSLMDPMSSFESIKLRCNSTSFYVPGTVLSLPTGGGSTVPGTTDVQTYQPRRRGRCTYVCFGYRQTEGRTFRAGAPHPTDLLTQF
jgi:hypothetical protein